MNLIVMDNVPGDLYYVEEALKELAPNLSMGFNYNTEEYVVYCDGEHVLNWPRPLDQRLITHMRKIDRRNGYDPFKEIDEHNEKLERTIERDRINHLESVVKYYQPTF